METQKTPTTSAQRMRELRIRAREVAWGSVDDEEITKISLSALLELVASESRKCHSDKKRTRAMMKFFLKELSRRLSL